MFCVNRLGHCMPFPHVSGSLFRPAEWLTVISDPKRLLADIRPEKAYYWRIQFDRAYYWHMLWDASYGHSRKVFYCCDSPEVAYWHSAQRGCFPMYYRSGNMSCWHSSSEEALVQDLATGARHHLSTSRMQAVPPNLLFLLRLDVSIVSISLEFVSELLHAVNIYIVGLEDASRNG